MALLTSAINTVFTPLSGEFIVQCSSGMTALQRRGVTGADWVQVGIISGNTAPIISNPVSGAEYQFTQVGSVVPVVRADQ